MHFGHPREVTSLNDKREKAGGFPTKARGTTLRQAPRKPGSPVAHLRQDGSCFPAMPTVLRHKGSCRGLTKSGREQQNRAWGHQTASRKQNTKAWGVVTHQRCRVPKTPLPLRANIDPASCLRRGSPGLCRRRVRSGRARSAAGTGGDQRSLPRHPTSSIPKRCRFGMEESWGHLPALDALSSTIPLQREVIL